MKDEKIREVYINWKGLECIHSLKYFFRIILIILSIIFIIISKTVIDNDYLLFASLIVLFLQLLSENEKEYYLKYKEIYYKSKNGKIKNYKSWIDFLDKTKGLNSFYRYFFGMFFKKFKTKDEK